MRLRTRRAGARAPRTSQGLVRREASPLPGTDATTGLDVGLTAFATLADGTEIANPRYYQRAQAKLRLAQRRVARRLRGAGAFVCGD